MELNNVDDAHITKEDILAMSDINELNRLRDDYLQTYVWAA